MLIDDALNHARDQRAALDALISEARDGKRAKELETENRTLTRKLERLEAELRLCKRKNNSLTSILSHVNGVVICNTCDGGGIIETDEGCEPCPDCNELGYIAKELEKMEVIRSD
jgi:hypothetical protein